MPKADPVAVALRALVQAGQQMLDSHEHGAGLLDALAGADTAQTHLTVLLDARRAERNRQRRARERQRPKPESRPLDAYTVGEDGRRVWTCTRCGASGPWEDGWKSFGTLDGPPIKVLCPECPIPDGEKFLDE